MTIFVVHASITLPWCFEDESTSWTDYLLDRLSTGDRAIVPAHWQTEISNGLLMAQRRKRINPRRASLFWDEPAALPIAVERPLSPAQAKAVFALAERHTLTVYDAAYLELAMRKNLRLATQDKALLLAASIEKVDLLRRQP